MTDLPPRLGERLWQRAASLSGGEQQMLAIGRALMTNPRLLILDDAIEGLAPMIQAEIWATIAALKQDSDMSIMVIDKTLSELAQVAESAAIIARGQTVWSGTMDDLSADVTEQYVGI